MQAPLPLKVFRRMAEAEKYMLPMPPKNLKIYE
jgi:hypothetical protein